MDISFLLSLDFSLLLSLDFSILLCLDFSLAKILLNDKKYFNMRPQMVVVLSLVTA